MEDLSGQTAVVADAHCGLGLDVSRELARRGAHVVMACPTLERAAVAMADITEDLPRANLTFEPLDISRQDSVRAFADRALARFERIHLLMHCVQVGPTMAKVEQQIGSVHLGCFALTNLLLERLVSSAPARVITATSMPRKGARRARGPNLAPYGQSKRTTVLFTQELARRLAAMPQDVRAVACAPGLSVSPSTRPWWRRWWPSRGTDGAEPAMFAATSPLARSGDVIAPAPWFEVRGLPARAPTSDAERDPEVARQLWRWSEVETGVRWSRAA